MVKQVRDELLSLKRKDGMVHAGDVVSFAKAHPRSALHGRFEWDDKKAGHQYRLGQARNLIQLHIRLENGEPRLISLTYDRARGGGYREIDDVMQSKSLAEIAEADALRELLRVRHRFGHIRRMREVWKQIDRVEVAIVGKEHATATRQVGAA